MEIWEALLDASIDATAFEVDPIEMVITRGCFDESGKLADTEYVAFAGCVATDSEWRVISGMERHPRS